MSNRSGCLSAAPLDSMVFRIARDHVKGLKGTGRPGPPPTFSPEEDRATVEYLQKISQWGFSHTRADFKELLAELCDLKVHINQFYFMLTLFYVDLFNLNDMVIICNLQRQKNEPVHFGPDGPSDKWISNWLKEHKKELCQRKAARRDRQRLAMSHEHVVDGWFAFVGWYI